MNDITSLCPLLVVRGARSSLTQELRSGNSDAPAPLGSARQTTPCDGALSGTALSESAPCDGALSPAAAKDGSSIGGPTPAEQASCAGPTRRQRAARVHLVLGPVGAGKSTFALQLARQHDALRLTLDDWMATLFRPDRPETGLPTWYAERAQRCIDQIWQVARQVTSRDGQVVLELGLLRREERERFYLRVADATLPLTIYVLEAAREVRRARVLERNRSQGATFSMLVPPEIFELASDLWQPLDGDECAGRDVRHVRTDG